MTSRITPKHEVTIRCGGHRSRRSGDVVFARIASAVYVDASGNSRRPERWVLRNPNGVQQDLEHDNGYLRVLDARGDGTTVLPPGLSQEDYARVRHEASATERRERFTLRCRGCLARRDSRGGDVQVASLEMLSDVLDRLALAGRTSVSLPDLETLLRIEKRHNR